MATTVNRTDTFEQWRTKTNTISTDLGTVASLNTTDKTSAVAAINELKSRTIYIGTTAVVTDRSSANQSLTGISSITLPGSTSGTVQIVPVSVAGTTVLTAPATSGTIVTTGDTGTVTNAMLAGSIANSKLVNSTISGVALGSNLNTLTLGDGLDGVSYNGSTGITAAVGSSIARRADVQYIGTTGVALNRASANLGLAGITSVAMPGGTSGTITLQPAAIAGTTTLTLPSGTGTILSDQSAINGSQLVAGSVANAKLAASSLTVGTTTISLGATSTTLAGLTSVSSTAFTGALTGNASTATTLQTSRNINNVAFNGSADITITAATPNALTVGTGVVLNSGTTFDGSAAKTISVDSSVVALKADTHYIGTTAVTLNRSSANLGLTGISSITLPGGTSGSVQLIPTAIAGTNTVLTLPATSGTVLTTASGIDGAQLNAGSVANTKLANSSVTVGTTTIALGASSTTLSGLTSVTSTAFVGNVTGNVSGNAGTVTNGVYTTDTGTVTNAMLAGNIANGKLASNGTLTLGTTALTLGSTSTTLAGLTSVTSTGFTGALTGNASTATTLQTARNINGVSFNGSADITVTANTTNALTIGTGLSGTSFNGSSAVTIANTGVLSIAGTTNQITASASTGAITLSLPQSIATSSSPTFAGITLTTATLNGAVAQNVNIADASKSNVYTLTNANANYTANPTRFAIDSAGNVTITGNLTVSGNTTLTSATYSPDWSAVTNKQYYGQIKDGATTAVAATNISNGDAIWFRSSNGVTVTVGSNDSTYGDNVLISLASVPNTSLANSTITIAGTSVALGASITQDTITGLSSTGLIKRTAANTLATASAGTDYVVPSGNITGSAGSVANALTIGTGLSGTSFNGSAAVTIANTGVLALTAGGAVTITGTNSNLTVAHTDTSSVADLSATANTFVTAQTYDTYGHVLSRSTATVDFTVAANYAFSSIAVAADTGYTWGTANAVTSQDADSSADTITLIPGNTNGVAGIDIQGNSVGVTDALRISHSDTSNLSGAYGTNGISSITVDGMGHVTAVSTATYLTSSTGVASITGTANQITASASTGAVTLSLPQDIATTSGVTFASVSTTGNVSIGGNLTVNGTTTTVNSTTLDVADLNITIGKNATTAAAANGAGLTVGNYASNPTLLYVNASDRWVMNRGVEGSSFVKTGGTSGQFLKADGSVDSSTYLTGNQTITVSGDATGSGTTSIALTLANSGVTANTYNNVTVNAKGLVTGGSNVAYLTSYTETSTLQNVTTRGSTTTTSITAASFVKSGGTSAQFLKADGSVDSSTYLTTGTAASTYQPIGSYQAADADLTAIAALAGTSGLLRKTAADTWSLDTNTYLTTGTAASTYQPIGSYQAADADLTAIAALSGTAGFLKKTAADTWALDTSTYLTSYTETSTLQNVTTRGATTTTSITAASFVKSGGTAAQFLKADGSVDSSTYLTTGTAASTYLTISNASSTYQPVDADLTAIAALAGSSGLLKKTAADTWALDTSTYLTGNQSITLSGDVTGTGTTAITATIANSAVTLTKMANLAANSIIGNNTGSTAAPIALTVAQVQTLLGLGSAAYTSSSAYAAAGSYQASSSELTAIAAVSTTGFLKRTGTNTWTTDTNTYLTTTSAASTYQPLDTDLTAIAALAGTSGLLKKTAADTWVLDTNTYLTSGNTVTSITGTSNQITASTSTGDITLSLPQSINTGASVQFGSLGVGAAASGTAGEIRATNNITAYYSSDERLKTNIVKIDNALDKVTQIDGVIYDWNDEYKKNHGDVDGYFVREKNSGVIAQQVEKVFPNVVAERADGYKAVRYELLVPLLIEAIKDLKAEIEELKKK